VEWVRLPEGGLGNGGSDKETRLGRTIGDLGVRSETGVSVLAVVRGEKVIPNPGAGLRLGSGDAVGILGTPEQRAAFRALVLEPAQDEGRTFGHRRS
jgi:K+/H+ antiporter YhaU regulatory subunit KhtT